MSTLKEKIQADFVAAFKAGDQITKKALSNLKADIGKWEKDEKNSQKELTDADMLSIIIASSKQRKQSIEAFEKAGRAELVDAEKQELAVLSNYLPQQMSVDELKEKAISILATLPDVPKREIKIGQAMGAFTKAYKGMFETQALKAVLEELV
jgi:uncharacterized protein YqeY